MSTSPVENRLRWKPLLPVEHGSWSLVLEPVGLSLIVAPSAAGMALALAAFAAFLARRPLGLAFSTSSLRSRARRVLVVCVIATAAAFMAAAALADEAAHLATLLLALPTSALFLWFDTRREARAEAAEICGALTFAILPLALARLAGWSWPLAAALMFTAAARSVPMVMTVRAFLRARRVRGNERNSTHAARVLVISVLFAAGALALGWVRLLPWLVTGLAVVQLGRSAWLLSPWAPRWPAMKLGMIEASVGIAHVLLAGIAWRLMM